MLMVTTMATPAPNLHDVSQAIQLALGPVFLLTGIAGTLNVMAGRLARIIDRARFLLESPAAGPLRERPGYEGELRSLEVRRHLASTAITFCTFAALLVCTVIVALFLEVMLAVPMKWLIGVLFAAATMALVAGLAYFLREVRLATKSIVFDAAGPPNEAPS